MKEFLEGVLNWSEVWAVLVPLAMLGAKRKQPSFIKPIIIYLFIALILNTIIDTIVKTNHGKEIEEMTSNNWLYNVHSLVRFACFAYFLMIVLQHSFKLLKTFLIVSFLIFTLLNFFWFRENFFEFYHPSGNLLTVEAYILLVMCMIYYLSHLKSDEWDFNSDKSFWVVTGLSLYVVINFFVFLFYVPLLDEFYRTKNMDKLNLATDIWHIHNFGYIIFCFFITKAFYVPHFVGDNK